MRFRVYDESGNVLETHEHKGDFRLDTSPKSSFSSTLTDSLEVS